MVRMLLLVLALLAAVYTSDAADARLTQCGTVPLPGVEGRLDHFALDPKGQRLFVAAMGNNSLEIVGIREGRRLQSIPGMKQPAGVAYLPHWNWVCVANGGDGTLRVYDAGNYQPKQLIRGLDDADNLRYDPETDLVFLGFGKGGVAIIDASQGQVVGMLKLPAHPEAFEMDKARQTLYINVPNAKNVTLFDLKKRELMGAWSMERFPAVYPMVLDEPNHRLWVGCRKPARLLALDTQSGKPTVDLPIAGMVDEIFLDSKHKRVYAICGDGVVEVIEQGEAGQFRSVEKLATAPGTRTGYYSEELDLLAVGVPSRGKQAAEVRLYQSR